MVLTAHGTNTSRSNTAETHSFPSQNGFDRIMAFIVNTVVVSLTQSNVKSIPQTVQVNILRRRALVAINSKCFYKLLSVFTLRNIHFDSTSDKSSVESNSNAHTTGPTEAFIKSI